MLFWFCNLAKYHESKTKGQRPKILCGSQTRAKAKAKKAETEKGRCVGQEFNRNTIENPEKAPEELHTPQ